MSTSCKYCGEVYCTCMSGLPEEILAEQREFEIMESLERQAAYIETYKEDSHLESEYEDRTETSEED
jgi:16S rRNA G527 N7-methylase RsmG